MILGRKTVLERSKIQIAFREVSKNHHSIVLKNDLKSVLSIRWFGPKFSPKDVPRFYDVSSITERPAAFQALVDVFVARYGAGGPKGRPPPTKILGYDARGFILGAAVAVALGIPLVLLRKDRKNPGVLVESAAYDKEYSEAAAERMCLRLGSVGPGDRVVLVDDLIATGGTALSGIELVTALGATVHEFAAVIELPALNGIQKIRTANGGRYRDVPVFTLLVDEELGPEACWDPADWKEGSRVVDTDKAKAIQTRYAFKLDHAVTV